MTHRRMPSVLLLLGCMALAGCPGGGDKEQTATPAPEIGRTAWWKQGEASGTDAAATATAGLTGDPLPAWQQLPPVDAALAQRGADLFIDKGCTACHSFGKGQVVGPDLQGITHRAEPDWVRRFLKEPDKMLESDPRAKELLAKYLVKMPNLNLDDDTINALVAYFRQQDAAAAKK